MPADYIGPNQEEKEEKLEGDYDTPFSPPQDTPSQIPKDYPTKDTDMDDTEWYQDGDSTASSTEFPDGHKKDKNPEGLKDA